MHFLPASNARSLTDISSDFQMDQVLLQQVEYTAPGSRPFDTSTLALFGLPGAPFEGVSVHSLLLDGSLAVWLRDAQQRALPGMDSVKVSVRILVSVSLRGME